MTAQRPHPFSFVHWHSGFALRTFLLGLPLLLLLLLGLNGGSIDQVATMLLISVVCTAGIGAVFWFGIALLLGILLQLLVPPLRGKPYPPHGGGDGLTTTDLLRPSGPLDSLTGYILRREAEGAGEATVRTDLRRAGWDADQVSAALQRARQHASSSPPASGG